MLYEPGFPFPFGLSILGMFVKSVNVVSAEPELE